MNPRTLHQGAAERLTGDVLATDLTPTLNGDVAQYHWLSAEEIDRGNGVGSTATNGLDRDDLGLEVLLSPCPHARGNHLSRIEAGANPSDTARASSDEHR